MEKILKPFRWVYYNCGDELIGVVICAILTFLFEVLGIESLTIVSLFLMILLFIVAVIELLLSYRKRESSVFLLRKTLEGHVISQAVIKDEDECLATIFDNEIDNGLAELPKGKYICYTHGHVIKRIEQFVDQSNGKAIILKNVPIANSKLKNAKKEIQKRKRCKECKRKGWCPFISMNSTFKMHGVKFKIS